MTAHTDEKHPKTAAKSAGPPALGFDAREFFEFVDETDWSDEEKTEYITLIWNIVCEFVAMGWGVHPIQQAKEDCGKPPENGSPGPLSAPDVVDSSHGELIKEFVRRSESLDRSSGIGVTDE